MTDGITALKTTLPAAAWTEDADIIAPHLVEWRDKYHGQTPLMLTPHSTTEVAEAVKICAAHGLKIVPQGGNTGLVGGQTPMGEVLLSLKKMTAVRDLDATNNAMIVEAGATLQIPALSRLARLLHHWRQSLDQCRREPCAEIWHDQRFGVWRRSCVGEWRNLQRSDQPSQR